MRDGPLRRPAPRPRPAGIAMPRRRDHVVVPDGRCLLRSLMLNPWWLIPRSPAALD